MQGHRYGFRLTAGRRKGAVIVELALIAPFLAVLILGVCEVCQVLRVRAVLADAARKGCATASAPGTSNADVIRDVSQTLEAGRVAASASVSISINDLDGTVATARRNDKIKVLVRIPLVEATWTGSYFFFSSASLQSESLVMLKQG